MLNSLDEAKRHLLEQLDPIEGVSRAIWDRFTLEMPYGWAFVVQSKEYIETGNIEHARIGRVRHLVTRRDGKVHPLDFGRTLRDAVAEWEKRDGVEYL